MKLHEYQSKQIFSKFGIPIPKGRVAATASEARQIAEELGGRVVIKSQVLVGGRGKAGGASLHLAPMLVPTPNTALRRALEQWVAEEQLQPAIAGEFEDSALLKAFGESGRAVFPAPTAIAEEVCRHYGVVTFGATDAVRERYYALSVERRVTHPGVVALSATARGDLFARGARERPARGRQRPGRRSAAS